MKKLAVSTSDVTEIALLAALITVTGAIKLPSLAPGLEFQLSAPLAVAICAVFGFKRYILAGVLSSLVGLLLGTQNLFNVAIAMQFRLVVGLVFVLFGRHYWTVALAGPLGTFTARITLSFVVGKGAWALVAAALPGMVFTLLAAPLLVKILDRIARLRRTADARVEIAERHVDDAQAAERRPECDDARLLRRRAADAAGVPAVRMLAHGGEKRRRFLGRAEGDRLALVRQFQRIEAEKCSDALDLFAHGKRLLVQDDADLCRTCDLVQDRRRAASRRISHAGDRGRGAAHEGGEVA